MAAENIDYNFEYKEDCEEGIRIARAALGLDGKTGLKLQDHTRLWLMNRLNNQHGITYEEVQDLGATFKSKISKGNCEVHGEVYVVKEEGEERHICGICRKIETREIVYEEKSVQEFNPFV